jgi:hypothetical protein
MRVFVKHKNECSRILKQPQEKDTHTKLKTVSYST